MIVPPYGRSPPVSDENAAGSWITAMHSACVCTDQNPSPSGVCAVGACHHTGAGAAEHGEDVVREAVRELVEIREIDPVEVHGTHSRVPGKHASAPGVGTES